MTMHSPETSKDVLTSIMPDVRGMPHLIERIGLATRRIIGRIGLIGESNTDGVSQRFETAGFVKLAPSLDEQILDEDRTTAITSTTYRDTEVSDLNVELHPGSTTEHDALIGLRDFLCAAKDNPDIVGDEGAGIAGSMVESLAYIGSKEFDEASMGMAEYLKYQLKTKPDLRLLLLVGGQAGSFAKDGRSAKSDGYLLEKILSNFSDEEIALYDSRLGTDPDEAADKVYHTKAILLDDWSTSGMQLRQAYLNLTYRISGGSIDEIEALLIAASEARIKNGLSLQGGSTVPIKAYFQAGDPLVKADMGKVTVVDGDGYPGYITGTHSSVDFNFDRTIAQMVASAVEKKELGHEVPDVLTTMPAATQIDRQYDALKRKTSPNIERFNRVKGKSYKDESGDWILRD